MQKWEYCKVLMSNGRGRIWYFSRIAKGGVSEKLSHDKGRVILNSLGEEGWEAVGFTETRPGNFAYLFKRPLED